MKRTQQIVFCAALVCTAVACTSLTKTEDVQREKPPITNAQKNEAGGHGMKANASIGTASMQADGTIILDLRAHDGTGMTGESRLTYTKGSEHYNEILKHLGGLKPGETKPVPPWDE